MLKRITTAAIGIVILIPFIIFSDTFLLVVFTSVLSAVGVYEILRCVGKERSPILLIPSVGLTVTLQILARTIPETVQYLRYAFMLCTVYSFIMLVSAVFSKGKHKISEMTTVTVMTVYVSSGFSSLLLLRDMEYGLVMFFLWFLIPWICDAMAYFTGVFFGKHKLIPDVSPKKTVEGAIGGIIGTLLITVIFGVVTQLGFGMKPNYPVLLLVTFIGCLVSQCGDLIASLVKREHGVKDYGKLFPGHGGVMDRFDSCIATGPFIYIVCVLFSSNALFY